MAHSPSLTRGPEDRGVRPQAGEVAPGAWLRLAALGGAAATALVVVSGALHLGLPHRLLAIVALPLLGAVVVAAATAHSRLLPFSVAALVLFVVESAFGGVVAFAGRPEWSVVLHLLFAGLALAAALVSAAASFQGRHVPAGAWRDYVR